MGLFLAILSLFRSFSLYYTTTIFIISQLFFVFGSIFSPDSSYNLQNDILILFADSILFLPPSPTFLDLSGSVKCLLQPRWWGLQLDNALLSFRQRRMAWHSLRSARQRVDPAPGRRWRAARDHGITGSQSGDCYWSRCGDAGQLIPFRT